MLHEPEGQLPDPRGWLDALPRRGAEALRGIRHLEALKRHVYKAKSIGEHGFSMIFSSKSSRIGCFSRISRERLKDHVKHQALLRPDPDFGETMLVF